MKKLIIASMAACALVVALAGCGSQQAQKEEAASSAAPEAAAETSAPAEEAETSTMVGMPNPWSDVATAEEAAAGAGLDGFSAAEGVEISLGKVEKVTYRCMEGIAEADVEFPAVSMTIRKGINPGGIDISGDYNEYAHTWTQDVDGIELTCAGNREGDSTKTLWTVDGVEYSIDVLGLGGDTDYGLSAEDLALLVPAIK